MRRLYTLNLRLIGLKLWIFYHWPIFWLVSYFSLQSLCLYRNQKQMKKALYNTVKTTISKIYELYEYILSYFLIYFS